MKTFLRSLLSVATLMLTLTACDVHQFPDEPVEPQRLILDLDFSHELPLYKVIEYPDGSAPTVMSRAADSYRVRHTVRIYRNNNESRSLWSRADPVFAETFYSPIAEDFSTEIEISLPDGAYTAMIWSDQTPVDETILPFHNVEDFSEITYRDITAYTGSEDRRDAFRGETDFDVPDEAQTENNIQRVTVEMGRPLGKFSLIATDVEQFISRSRSRTKGDTAGEITDSRAFDFADYKARLVYTGYLPSAFNMFLNKPVDSKLGVYFDSEIRQLSSTEAELAFDHVMVNGSESKVDAVLQILDRNNKVLAQSAPMRIPLVRSRLTEVRGKFLTADNSSGVGIKTEFDGEYNIEIK